jgi:TetR/AcrR family transcriptional regulator
MFDSLIEFIEDSLITRINLILKDEKDTSARLRLIVLLILGFGERNPGLTRILTGHALMFEQDRLQGRINQLFERIEVQLRQVMREKKMREGEGYTVDEALLASQLLAFCEGMLSRFVRSEFKYRPTDDFDARWPLVAAQQLASAARMAAYRRAAGRFDGSPDRRCLPGRCLYAVRFAIGANGARCSAISGFSSR